MSRRAELEDLVARRDVYAVLTRYCRALDRADVELMRTVYWPDGVDIHGIYSGNAAEFVEFIISEITQYFEMGTHCLLNVDIKVDGDVACSESYLYSACRVRENMTEAMFGSRYFKMRGGRGLDAGNEQFVMAGRYLDRLERRNGEWRIAKRQVVMDWNDSNPSNQILDEGLFKTMRPRGEWGHGDPVYGNILPESVEIVAA
ncbi:nuclear transport factor 2 family protein [Sphingobium phenoxybenzoativorans]|uniref:Nuclear transport factor 2 family protein n=1 Tax=Sphingobium phenoxybenzoativorans TaxID=1592790 RepID=A0A975K9L0_9SPHN|nr:nuclear transport factor 2 family protein [Sphingobium phenoxybenzoativorans]QUT07343.1 nuclear transport factor 2 family protein [Sphingobium phenoxybenzoativorans]